MDDNCFRRGNATQRFGEWQFRETKHLPEIGQPLLSGSNMFLGKGEEFLEAHVDASGTVLKHQKIW